jgi:hypothetical protein
LADDSEDAAPDGAWVFGKRKNLAYDFCSLSTVKAQTNATTQPMNVQPRKRLSMNMATALRLRSPMIVGIK